MSPRDAHILRALLAVRNSLSPADAASRRALAELLGQARELPDIWPPALVVGLDDRVTVRFITGSDQDPMVFQVVLPASGSATQGRISVLAPVSLGVLGRKVGDRVLIATPAGDRQLEILQIQKAARHAHAS
jgi:transcription elongation GreA/GreB family factor